MICRCGRPTDKRGKTCCSMCWIGYGPGSHSHLCRKRTTRALEPTVERIKEATR